jgi:hypothetical protein
MRRFKRPSFILKVMNVAEVLSLIDQGAGSDELYSEMAARCAVSVTKWFDPVEHRIDRDHIVRIVAKRANGEIITRGELSKSLAVPPICWRHWAVDNSNGWAVSCFQEALNPKKSGAQALRDCLLAAVRCLTEAGELEKAADLCADLSFNLAVAWERS